MPEIESYDETEASSTYYSARNIVTVARALDGKRLNKTIYADGHSRPYDNAYSYRYFSIYADDLLDLCNLVNLLLHRPQSCLIRGVAKDDSITRQRRLLYYDKKTNSEPTIIEQPQNWFALDIDGFGRATGNIKDDARVVLLALGLGDTQCFAIPSASYMIKDGIRIRLFLWNNVRITCLSLKKYFTRIVDPALFHPIQPIYTARPTFVGRNDPCEGKLVAWIPGDRVYTDIPIEHVRSAGKAEERYTKKQAEAFFKRKAMNLWDVPSGERHKELYAACIFFGKLIGQELLDENDVVEFLMMGCAHYWQGDAERDHKTILDGLKRGNEAMGETF